MLNKECLKVCNKINHFVPGKLLTRFKKKKKQLTGKVFNRDMLNKLIRQANIRNNHQMTKHWLKLLHLASYAKKNERQNIQTEKAHHVEHETFISNLKFYRNVCKIVLNEKK